MADILSQEDQNLIHEFLNANQMFNNPHYLSIAVYGSKIQNTARANSDIDIFVMTDLMKNVKMGQLFQNVRFDVSIYSLKTLYDFIYEFKENNHTYFDSIFQNHFLVKDSFDTFLELSNYVESLPKLSKKNPLTTKQIANLQEIHQHFIKTMQGSDLSMNDYWYYNLLEIIRIYYYQRKDCSYINPLKVYDCYTKDTYKKNYLLTMPSNHFIETFLNAVHTKDVMQRQERVETFFSDFHLKDLKNAHSTVSISPLFLNQDQIKMDLLGIRNNISRCEEMLLHNHPYSEYAYSILLRRMSNYYEAIYFGDSLEEMPFAIGAKTSLERVAYLEKIYGTLSKDYSFDYDHYQLVLR